MKGLRLTWAALAVACGLAGAAGAAAVRNGDFQLPTWGGASDGTWYTPGFGTLPTNGVDHWDFGPSASPGWDGLLQQSSSTWGIQVIDNQGAFVEGKGWISQVIDDINVGLLSVSFYSSAATIPALTPNPVQVKLDDTVLTFLGGVNTTVTPIKGVSTLYTSDFLSVSAGSHTLTFLGTGDGTAPLATIDNVSITNTLATVINSSFEIGGAFNGWIAIPWWTQAPYPSGAAGYDYLSGLATTSGYSYCDNGIVPDGINVALIEVYSTANTLALQQTVYGFSIGKTYQLQFYENARAIPVLKKPLLTVTIDGATNVASHVVTSVDAEGVHSHPFTLVKGAPFTATSTSMTISFIAGQQTAEDDAILLLDSVSFTNIIPCGTIISIR